MEKSSGDFTSSVASEHKENGFCEFVIKEYDYK
jgi:hypothetical protein